MIVLEHFKRFYFSIKRYQMSLKILEPIRAPLKEFESAEAFMKYFEKHHEEMDKETTCKLNKMYKIPGLWITKIKGQLCLKKPPKSSKSVEPTVDLDDLLSRVEQLEETMQKIIDVLNEQK